MRRVDPVGLAMVVFATIAVAIGGTMGVRYLSRNPQVSIIGARGGNVGDQKIVRSVTLLPREKTDWIWWTSSDPSRITVWPTGLKVGMFPNDTAPAFYATAEMKFIYPGKATICAELHRRLTKEEVNEVTKTCTTVTSKKVRSDSVKMRIASH